SSTSLSSTSTLSKHTEDKMERLTPFSHREIYAIAEMAIERLNRFRKDDLLVRDELQTLQKCCRDALADRLVEDVTGQNGNRHMSRGSGRSLGDDGRRRHE